MRSSTTKAMIVAGGLTMAPLAQADVPVGVPLAGDPAVSEYDRHVKTAADLAARTLNEAGGVLGEPVRLIFDSDDCEAEPAVAAARRFAAEDVRLVVGHICSGPAIAASKVYEEAGILMMSGTAFDPRVTEDSGANVFRICGRSDKEAEHAADLIAREWPEATLAILHDGEAYGQGLAEATRANLNQAGVQEALFEQYAPGKEDYSDLVAELEAAKIDVVYIGGYKDEIGVIIRQAHERGYRPQLISGSGLISPGFIDIAGAAGEGALFTTSRDPRSRPEAAEAVAALRAQGIGEPNIDALYTYAVFEVWAQAVNDAGTLDLEPVANALQRGAFDSAVGKVRFDEKGDVTDSGMAWFVWTKDGPVPRS